MTFETYQYTLQQFQQHLQQTQTKIAESQLTPAAFRTEVQQIQEIFQTQLLPMDLASDSSESGMTLEAQRQPIQIEINKQLRLLETDAIFLQAARQPTTLHQRQQQIHERLALLLRYCHALLDQLQAQ